MKLTLTILFILITLFSISQNITNNPIKGSKIINIYTTNDYRNEAIYYFCDYLISNNIQMNIQIFDDKFAISEKLHIKYKGNSVYSQIYILSKIINDTIILVISGHTDPLPNKYKSITKMEYLNEENVKYSKNVLFKIINNLATKYKNKTKITYTKWKQKSKN
jgi:hypothetical protein